MGDIDFPGCILFGGIILIIILCSGDPDLLDAIISYIGRR